MISKCFVQFAAIGLAQHFVCMLTRSAHFSTLLVYSTEFVPTYQWGNCCCRVWVRVYIC